MAQELKVYGSGIKGLWPRNYRFIAQELKVYGPGIKGLWLKS